MSSTPFSFDPYLIGEGKLERLRTGGLRLALPSNRETYCDAQVDDYHRLPRKRFLWRPPVHLQIRARASHLQPPGTLGFGFWNDPFTFSLGQGGAARRLPAAPKAIWFFYASPHSDICLCPNLPGHGWKAVSLRSATIPPALLALPAAIALALSQTPFLRGPILRSAAYFVRSEENLINLAISEWHEYTIDWDSQRAIFRVDDHLLFEAKDPPQGPLGFVAWIDNQYAVASPDRGFRFGVLPTDEEQWLELDSLKICRDP